MGLATYFSPVVTWSVGITVGILVIPPVFQGFVVGGGANLIEQAKHEVAQAFSWIRAPEHAEFRAPIEGNRVVTSPFGMRNHPKTGQYAMHNGKDYRCTIGDKVGAIAEGVVNHAGNAGNAGLLVAIDHADGMQSLYMHLSAIDVTVGQQVPPGGIIGKCGNTGRSTAPHLHLGIKRNGQYIDPTTKGL